MREIRGVYKVQIVCNYTGDPKCASRIHRRLLTTAPSSLATVANWHHGKWFKFDIRSSTGWYLLQSTGILVSIKRFQIGDKVNWSEEKEHTYVEGCNKSWKRKGWITFLKSPLPYCDHVQWTSCARIKTGWADNIVRMILRQWEDKAPASHHLPKVIWG